jgi:hypothetical protein
MISSYFTGQWNFLGTYLNIAALIERIQEQKCKRTHAHLQYAITFLMEKEKEAQKLSGTVCADDSRTPCTFLCSLVLRHTSDVIFPTKRLANH